MSRGKTDLEGVIDLVRAAGGRVRVLTGAHGNRYGRMGYAHAWAERWNRSLRQFVQTGALEYQRDVQVLRKMLGGSFFQKNPRVIISDIREMSHMELRTAMTSGDDVIVNVCYGALNCSVTQAFDAATKRVTNGKWADNW